MFWQCLSFNFKFLTYHMAGSFLSIQQPLILLLAIRNLLGSWLLALILLMCLGVIYYSSKFKDFHTHQRYLSKFQYVHVTMSILQGSSPWESSGLHLQFSLSRYQGEGGGVQMALDLPLYNSPMRYFPLSDDDVPIPSFRRPKKICKEPKGS